jgi:tripartite-type tricarboxylate transporter receptor subunit TctC
MDCDKAAAAPSIASRGRSRVVGKRMLLTAIAAVGLTALAAAQSYPERPIRLIVPFPPGGPTDFMARLIAQHLSANVGQVIIDNRPGAGGTIAAKVVANADPDGYTLLFGSSATLGIAPALYKNVDYDPIKSFAPIALVSRVPFILVIAPSVPAKTLAEFVAYARANPGKLNFGAGVGTPPHLVGELFKLATGTDIVYVPYKGAAASMTDLLAGQTHMTIEGATTVLPHIQAGRVRALAVMSADRVAEIPDVPTMIESGYPGFPESSWTGVLAPMRTPASVVGRLNAAINQGLRSPEIQANFAKFGAQAKLGSPQDFAAFIAAEAPVWAALVKASAAKVE